MNNNKLYGAILGDLCGQPFEFAKHTGYNKPIILHNEDSVFTDDSVMTLATAFAIMENISYEAAYKYFGEKYTNVGYGNHFAKWLKFPMGSVNNSWGNGNLMRCSPILYTFYNDKIFREANIGASLLNSHNTRESVLTCLQLDDLYQNGNENLIISNIEEPKTFSKFEVEAIPTIKFVTEVFCYTNSTHEAILKAVECGGDADTNASIVGELSNHTYNDLDDNDISYVENKLDSFLLDVLKSFNEFCR